MQWKQKLIDKEGIRFYAQIKLQFFYGQNGFFKWVVLCMDHLCPDNGHSSVGLLAEAATDKDSCQDDSPGIIGHHHDHDQDYSCQLRCEEKQQPYLTSETATRTAAPCHGSLRVQSLLAHSQGLETTTALQPVSPSPSAASVFLQELQTSEIFESLSSAISVDYSRQQQQHTSSSSSTSSIDSSEEASEMWIERVMHEAMSNPLESSVGGGGAMTSPLFSAWMDSLQSSSVECGIIGDGVGGGVDKMEDPLRGRIEKRRNEEGEEERGGGGLECMSLFYGSGGGGGGGTSAFGVHL